MVWVRFRFRVRCYCRVVVMFYEYWLLVRVTGYWFLVKVTVYWSLDTGYELMFGLELGLGFVLVLCFMVTGYRLGLLVTG